MAKKATEHCHKQMIWHASKKNPPSLYHISETVMVRVKDGAHRVSKKYWVLPGKIMKRNLKLSKYKVQFQILVTLQCKKNGSLCLMSPVQRDREKKCALQSQCNIYIHF